MGPVADHHPGLNLVRAGLRLRISYATLGAYEIIAHAHQELAGVPGTPGLGTTLHPVTNPFPFCPSGFGYT